MQTEDVLGKILFWIVKIGKVIVGTAIIIGEKFFDLWSLLRIGDRLSKPAEKLGLKFSGRQIDKILCIVLCLVLITALFSMCASEKSGGGGSSLSLMKEDCWACRGSGNCQECGGDSRKVEWVGDQYMDLRCTSCIGGNCSWCNGSGKE